MPSYRVTMIIGALASGVAPDSVLPIARTAAEQRAVVEAIDLQVVSGQARIVLRFAADDPEIAANVAYHVAAVTGRAVGIEAWHLAERNRSLWNPVRTAP